MNCSPNCGWTYVTESEYVALAVGHAEVIRAVNSKQTSRHNCGPRRAQPAHQHHSNPSSTESSQDNLDTSVL
jgi:hypothetical protein